MENMARELTIELRKAFRNRNPHPQRGLALAAFAALSLPLGLVQPVPVSAPAATTSTLSESPLLSSAAAPVKNSDTRIVVSIPQRKLALVERGKVKKVYRVAVGAKESPSPTGHFKIVNKVARPGYWREGKAIRPGKDNPVGSRWMGLDMPHYGIHGTTEPETIGQAASHGCIRMADRDLKELFAQAHIGEEVVIENQALEFRSAAGE